MKRMLWFAVGAVGTAAALVASPELYTRLRERVAGGPVGELEPAHGLAPVSAMSFPPEEDEDDTAEIVTGEPPPDEAADDLRSRIGEGRARLREKAMASAPDLGEDEAQPAPEADPAPEPGA